MNKPPWLGLLASLTLLVTAVGANATPQSSGLPGARAFAARIVAALNTPPDPRGARPWGVPMTADWYDAGWMQLVHDAAALEAARQVVSFLDGVDPVCRCDHPGFTYRVISVTMRRDGLAAVRMDVFTGNEHSNFPIMLSQTVAGQWRVYGSIYDDIDWRRDLTSHVACLRGAQSHQLAMRCN